MSKLTLPVICLLLCNICYVNSDIKQQKCSLREANCNPSLKWKYSEQYYKLITGGLPQILWDAISPLTSTQTQLNVTESCLKSLLLTSEGMKQGKLWAFRLPESSSRTPPGFLEGTITSYGDFDQCLDILTPDFAGKYCMIGLGLTDLQEKETDTPHQRVKQTSFPFIHFNDPRFGLCFPSTCSSSDIKSALEFAAKGYPLEFREAMVCSTKKINDNRIYNLNVGQTVSLTFIATVIVVVISSTLLDCMFNVKNGLISSFSLYQNGQNLILVEGERVNFIDYTKLIASFVAIFLHSVCCLDSPFGLYVLDKVGTTMGMLRNLYAQPLANEATLGASFTCGGVVTVYIVGSVIRKGKFNPVKLVAEKWFRYLPALGSIVAFEFIWPLLGSGPLFPLMSDHILNNCSKNWWMNFLFIHNWKSSFESCVPHTFHSSIDFQLYFLGIFVVYLLHKSVKLAVIFAFIVSGISMFVTGYASWLKQTPPCIMPFDANVHKAIEYLDIIHFATYTYTANYLIGIMIGHCLDNGYRLSLKRTHKMLFIGFCASISVLSLYSTALHNVYQVLPQHLVPLYIVIHRQLIPVLLYAVLLTLPAKDKAKRESNKNEDKKTKTYNVFAGLCRIHLSIYMVNYFVIRYDFFTTRVLFESSLFSILKRVASNSVLTFIFASFFHLFFVSPFESLRKRLVEKLKKD